MDREELRHHIDSAAPHVSAAATQLSALMFSACWPGGGEDRTERAALESLRQWHPDQSIAELPSCSCSTGRCVVCN